MIWLQSTHRSCKAKTQASLDQYSNAFLLRCPTLHEADRGYVPEGTHREPVKVKVGKGFLASPARQLMPALAAQYLSNWVNLGRYAK